MPKASMNLTKFCFCEKYARSYLVVFIDKKPKMSPFAKNRNAFAVLVNELVGNIVQVNTKCIHVF